MTSPKKIYFLPFFLLLWSTASSQKTDLYNKIVELDKEFFSAYNNCDLARQAEFYSDSIEFYHDKGGLQRSKKLILADTEKYVCGKVTRELVDGSIEVSPIPGYGAVELGSHKFHNVQDNTTSPASKFVIIWKNDHDKWTMTRVISLH